ncbi:MAG: DUF192 domain-containing protein [Candidatus Taylorbacteria bacterium]|nr:DUF192 domain-containing protein [Candidatus Taylorbacteria bacterium]
MRSKIGYFSLGGIILVVLVLGVYRFSYAPTDNLSTPSADSKIEVEKYLTRLYVVTSDTDREIGLSKFSSLQPEEGMLFVFDSNNFWKIWMKDMKFSIDIIFLDQNFRVIGLHENISPESYPATYSSVTPSRYVLETNAGFITERGIKVGQTVIFDQKTVYNSTKKEVN